MNITNLKPSDIIPYVNNPRHNESAVDAVASSIRDFGFNLRQLTREESMTE